MLFCTLTVVTYAEFPFQYALIPSYLPISTKDRNRFPFYAAASSLPVYNPP